MVSATYEMDSDEPPFVDDATHQVKWSASTLGVPGLNRDNSKSVFAGPDSVSVRRDPAVIAIE